MKEAQKLVLADQGFIPLHFQEDLYAKSKKLVWIPRADHYFWYKETRVQ